MRGSTRTSVTVPLVLCLLYFAVSGYAIYRYSDFIGALALMAVLAGLAVVIGLSFVELIKFQHALAFIRLSNDADLEWLPDYARGLRQFSDRELRRITSMIMRNLGLSPQAYREINGLLESLAEQSRDRDARIQALVRELVDIRYGRGAVSD